MKLSSYLEILKAVIFGLILVVIGVAVYKGTEYFRNYQAFGAGSVEALRKDLDEQNRKFLAFTENIVRAQTEIVSKIQADQGMVNQHVLELIKANREEIRNIGTIQAGMNEALSRRLRVESDHEYKPGSGDPNEQYFKKIMTSAKNEAGEVVEIPLAWAIYYPNRKPEERWKTGIYPLEYYTKVVQSEQSTGQWNTYVEAWAENNKDPESKGERLPLKITVAEFKQTKQDQDRFHWFNPKIDFGITMGSANQVVSPALGLSFLSYGRTEDDLTWRFLRIGAAWDIEREKFIGIFSPVGYNLAKHIPVITNLWAFPDIQLSEDGKWGVGLSLNLLF